VRTEFAVIGGGITGLATAWALARRGREVSVLEQAAVGHAGSGSHGACRVFRFGYEDAEYVNLVRHARELWAELETTCGERLLLPTPQLTIGPLMWQVRDALLAAGAACELLSVNEAAERFPGVRIAADPAPDGIADLADTDGTAGPGAEGGLASRVLLEPDSAVIAADRTLTALANAVRSAGQVVWSGVTVTALADDGRGVKVSTSARDVEASRVIVCAGPGSAGLLDTAGIAIPASATMEQVAYFAPAGTAQPTAMPIFVHYGGEFPYGLPVPGSDRYKVGLHHGGPAVDPGQLHHTEDAGLTRRIEQAARTFLPGLDPRAVAVERCVYDDSPDTDFILDRIGNVVIGCGTSGHGFKFGPLLGEWLATLATEGTGPRDRVGPAAEPPPRRFALSRF